MNWARKDNEARFLTLLALWLGVGGTALAERRYSVRGLILKLDPAHKTMIVSADAIPGRMEAMTMPCSVRDAKELDGLKLGTFVDFTLVAEKNSSYAEAIRAIP